MRILDALKTITPNQKKRSLLPLSTPFQIDPIPLPSHPRPQMQRDDWINLNGLWKYAITSSSKRPAAWEGEILVPFSPESDASGIHRTLLPGQYLWYERTVCLPALPKGRLLLHLDAVDERCAVWWNGHLLGTHRNGYLAFSFDVTQWVRRGENILTISVMDDSDTSDSCIGKQKLYPKGMYYTAQSGIWQSVWLETVPNHYIQKLKLTPYLKKQQLCLELTATAPLPVEVMIQEEPLHTAASANSWTQHASDCWKLKLMITLRHIHPWTPDLPYLYSFTLIAGEDRIQSYFALRDFSVGTDDTGRPCLLLNNKPIFYNGVLDQGYWPESLMTPPSDEAMCFDIQNMKRLGFNMIRKHIKVEPLRWYYHCDRLGMLVWQDFVNGGRISPLFQTYLPTVFTSLQSFTDRFYFLTGRRDSASRRRWICDSLQLIEQLYNCPCISLWVLFNEGWGQFDSAALTQRIRQADPTRLIDAASGWFDQGAGDVCSEHNYFRPLRIRQDPRPYVLSEYGGCTWSVKGHRCIDTAAYGYQTLHTQDEFIKAFRKLQDNIHALSKQGLCGAVYTQVSDIEEELNGLYTYDRKLCKADPSI